MNVVANTATVLTAIVTKACAVLRADSACTYAFCTLRLSPRQLSGLAVISMLASSPPTLMSRALRTTKTTRRMMPGTAYGQCSAVKHSTLLGSVAVLLDACAQ